MRKKWKCSLLLDVGLGSIELPNLIFYLLSEAPQNSVALLLIYTLGRESRIKPIFSTVA